MSFKCTFIGAGSITFSRKLLSDLLTVPEFKDIEVAFTDINYENLRMAKELCQRDIDENGLKINIEVTVDRREAVTGARYIFNLTRIGGLEAFATDIDIPLKYGVDQCVGDTLCAGGIMYGQRGIAAMLDFCRDIREVSEENAILLNYGNPNAMLTWAANKYGGVQTIGLCHGVESGHRQIAKALGIEADELDMICAGINHQTWYIGLKYKGEDMCDKVLEAFENDEYLPEAEKVRIDMMKRFGYYSTESNGHLSEYVAWYRKRPEDIKDWICDDTWIQGETGGYLRHCSESRDWFETDFPKWLAEAPVKFIQEERSSEHGSYIVEGLETGRVYRGHFNVVNNGVITNLPDECIVEVPGYVDANGVSIPIVGDLPMGCAAVCSQSIWVQRLAVEAAVDGDDQLLRQAMMLDPLTGAVCNPPEIWQMVDEMLVAQEQWLPQYAEAIAEAKARLESDDLIPVKEGYQGAARKKIKSVEEMRQDKEQREKDEAAASKNN